MTAPVGESMRDSVNVELNKTGSTCAVDLAISFVGVNNYQKTKYKFDEHTVETDLFPIFVAEVFKPKYQYVFLTQAAKEKHYDHLKDEFESRYLDAHTHLVPVEIPDGKTEAELWEIFRKLVLITSADSEGKDKKCMLIDITHGFRSLPAFAIAACAYLQEVRNVEIVNILYGAYEAKDDSNTSPVLDLTNLANMFRWLTSAHDLIEWGRGDALASDLYGIFNAIPDSDKRNNASLRCAADALIEYSKSLTLNRTKEFAEKTYKLSERLNSAQPLLDNIPTLQLLLKDTVRSLDRDFPQTQDLTGSRFAQLKWHTTHNYIYNAVSIARELLVTHVALKFGFTETETEDMDNRKLVEGWLNHCARNSAVISSKPLTLEQYKNTYSRYAEMGPGFCDRCKQPLVSGEGEPSKAKAHAKKIVLPYYAQILDSEKLKLERNCWDRISEFRNDLMHSQFGREGNNVQVARLRESLTDIYNLLNGETTNG